MRSVVDTSFGVGVDWWLQGTFEDGWLFDLDYSRRHGRANDYAMELEHAKLHHHKLQFM